VLSRENHDLKKCHRMHKKEKFKRERQKKKREKKGGGFSDKGGRQRDKVLIDWNLYAKNGKAIEGPPGKKG